jgi:hypothetical protein
MRIIGLILLVSVFTVACSNQEKEIKKQEWTNEMKIQLISEFSEMEKLDQLNRSFLQVGTLNQRLIDSVSNLSNQEYFTFLSSHESELSKDQQDSLWSIQNEIDLKNTNRLYSIIEKYGWPSTTKLDSIVSPMIFLFHTPLETINKMQDILFNEVKENRMEPIKYATYVDNMRKKAFGKNQLYGTGDEFDPNTNSIVPPFIENIDSTNMERIKIGLPELKEGEYRCEK